MIKRRHFLGGLFSLGITSLGATNLIAKNNKKLTSPKKIILPKRLKIGDSIGLIAPGFSVSNEKLERMVSFLESSGFNVIQTGRMGQEGYFSNTDQERANDINEMFSNPEVNAILCARGGYGCTRILDLLDYNLIKQNPKLILGFSDVTALLQAIHLKTGLIGFHGPVGTTLENKYAQSCLENLIMTPSQNTLISPVSLEGTVHEKESEYERYTIKSGTAEGSIIGGSLTLMCALIGTNYEMDFSNAIVFIEDVEEKPYRIDRMLTQLLQTKTFKKAAGVAFGVCAGCDTEKNQENFTLKEVLLNRMGNLEIPVAYGLSFGHVPDNCTLPIGAQAQFNADTLEILIKEPVIL